MTHIQKTLLDCCADSHVLPSWCRSQRTHVVHVQMDKHFGPQWLNIRTAIYTITKLCVLSHERVHVGGSEPVSGAILRSVPPEGFEHETIVRKIISRTNIIKSNGKLIQTSRNAYECVRS